jgi:hypothetical protein
LTKGVKVILLAEKSGLEIQRAVLAKSLNSVFTQVFGQTRSLEEYSVTVHYHHFQQKDYFYYILLPKRTELG